MSKIIIRDTILILLLIGLACACYFPLLPNNMTMIAYSAMLIIFVILAVVSWHEKVQDEREEKHRSVSSQVAFFAGGFVLITGIAYQGFVENAIDVWLIAAFSAMLIGRVVGRLWAQRNC